jgi:hypothetical protein
LDCIAIRKAISSTSRACSGNTSLTQRPECPCLRKLNGLFMIAPGMAVNPSGFTLGPRFWPCSFSKAGLWSKVSIGLAPPFMNNSITRGARGLWCSPP